MATLNGVNYSNTSGLLLKTNSTTQMSISTSGVIQFNQSYTFPTSDGSANEVLLTNGSGALSFGTVPNAGLTNSSLTLGSTSVSLGGTASSIAGLTSITADTVYANSVLRISQNGDGLRMTNVGAFDNDGSDNFRIFSNNDLILATNGDSGTAVTFDSSTKDATFQGEVIGSFSGSGANLNSIPNASLDNSSITINGSAVSLGGSINVGDITGVSAGTGLTGGGTSGSVTISVDYAGTDNFIDSATDLEGTDIALTDTIIYHDATDNNVKKGLVSDLPFTSTLGTVTSVAISGSDGIDVDSGSPITSSGTIALGLSNVPNSSLANSSVTVGSTSISLGSTSTTLAGLSSVTSTAFVGDLTGDVNGNASTADTWANSRTLTLGTDLSGNVSFNGSANFTLNASIVSGAVGSTELATNAVTTVKITDGNVTNAKLANSSFTVNAPSGSDPVVPLGGTLNFTSSDSSVVIAGNSTTDTIDLTVGNAVNTYVTGGTFTTGTLSLELNDGSSAQDITGLWSSIPNSALSNSSLTVTAGNGLANGGSVSLGGSVTLNVGAAVGGGISVGANDISLDTSSSRNVDHDSVSISAGTGLSGGGTIASNRTLSLDYAGTDNFIDSATNLEGTSISTSDTIIYHDATDNNVKKGLVSDLPFTNSSGSVTSVAISGSDGIDVDSGSPITSSGTIALGLSNVPNSSLANSSVTVTAGNGLANGGSVSLGSSVTLNVGAGTGIQVNANDIALDYAGTDNYIYAAGTGTGDITTSMYIPVSDASNNVKKYTVAALPFTNNQGTVTSVGITAGALIDVTNSPITSSGNITVDVDLSELTTSTSNGDGDYFAVVDTSNVQRKLTKANINLSGFNDDLTIYSADGTLSGTRTLNQSGSDLQFRATGTEDTKFYRSTTTSNTTTRVFMEASDAYQNVLELFANGGTPNLVEGYDQGQASVFRVDAQGNLTAISKAFDIPHPNPEKKEQGMRLKHGNLEGPEHGVYVRGRQLNDKEIELPEYWRDLVDPDSITVQLTSVGSHQNLYVKEIKDNVVYIGNGNLFSNKIDCYYFIQAERKDIKKITIEY